MEDGPLDILITNFLKSIILVEAHLKMSELLEVSAGGDFIEKDPRSLYEMPRSNCHQTAAVLTVSHSTT
jgi:hypothetical protein